MGMRRAAYRDRLCPVLLTGLLLNPVVSLAAEISSQGWNIPAQPLEQTLTQIARQAGISIGVRGEYPDGIETPAINGQMDLDTLLSRVLEGSGLYYEKRMDGNIVLLPATYSGEAEKVVITGHSDAPYGGAVRLPGQLLSATPSGNGNLTDLLEQIPAIESQGASRSSHGAGEIKPENISINGARFFQNAFEVDGIGINNDLDPGQGDPSSMDRIGSHSQGLYVDLDAIASVVVKDHNISAEDGGFTGGKVDVETRRYTGENSFGVSWRHTSDSLTNYHYDEEEAEEFEKGELGWFEVSNSIQPRFEKNFYNIYGSFGHGKDWGSFVTLSQNKSSIPFLNSSSRIYTVDPDGTLHVGDAVPAGEINQYRKNENLTLKTSWTPSDSERLDIRLLYGTGESLYQMGAVPDSEFTDNHHSVSLGLGYKNVAPLGRYSIDFDVTHMGDERESDNEYYAVIAGLNSDRAEASGGPYAMDNSQTTITLKPAFHFNPVSHMGVEHNIGLGAEVVRKEMSNERPSMALNHVFMCYTASCSPDTLTYFSKVYNYAYSFEIEQEEYGLWLEDDIRVGRLQVRPGVRVDYNSFLKNTDVAPRLAAYWDLLGDGKTHIEAGFNRYYGRSFMEYHAHAISNNYMTTVLRPGTAGETVLQGSTDWNTLTSLDTPYDDERVLGISHQFSDLRLSLTGINRKGRDQINSYYDRDIGETYYTNDSSSETDTVTLEMATTRSLPFAGAWWRFNGSLKWMERKSNQLYESYGSNAVYDGSLGSSYSVDRTDRVIYEGKAVDRQELPVNAMGTPLKAQLSVITTWPEYNLSMSNFLTWKDEYDSLRQLSNPGMDPDTGERLHAFVKEEYDQSYTWDLQLKWEQQFNDMRPYVQLDVLNVLDDQNVASASSSNVLYDIGRQYWLEFGIHF